MKKREHPLKIVRACYGEKQTAFAQRIGVSRKTIAEIELCMRPLKGSVEDRVVLETGVPAMFLQEGFTKALKSLCEAIIEPPSHQKDCGAASKNTHDASAAKLEIYEFWHLAIRQIALMKAASDKGQSRRLLRQMDLAITELERKYDCQMFSEVYLRLSAGIGTFSDQCANDGVLLTGALRLSARILTFSGKPQLQPLSEALAEIMLPKENQKPIASRGRRESVKKRAGPNL